MQQNGSVIIIGAGIIGSAVAYQLARVGRQVTVIGGGHATATGSSFGWINASFFLDDDHHHLRAEGIAAWRRLGADLEMPVQWMGCLCWDQAPEEMARTKAQLDDLGYPSEMLTRAEVLAKEPALRQAPEAALFFPTEGAAMSGDVPTRLIAAAQGYGAQFIRDVQVDRIIQTDGGRASVVTALGILTADQVVIAAGTASQQLAATVGGQVPLVHRPAYILRSQSTAPLLNHILASPIGEIRQEPNGQLLIPAAVGHQGDTSDRLAEDPHTVAKATMQRLQGLLEGIDDLRWAEVAYAERPVPADGKPIIGEIVEGVYVACLHSGITLGPIVAELACKDLTGQLDNADAALLASYRPERFSS